MRHDIETPSLNSMRILNVCELARLPMRTRVVDRLTEMLILADELLAEFQTEEANGMLWLEANVQRLFDDIDALIKRLAQ